MRIFSILAALAGLLGGTAVVGYFGFSQVAHALLSIGWAGLAAILVYRLAATTLLGLCWWLLVVPRRPLPAFVWGRLIRDAAAEVLPLSQIGGFVMGARAAALMGVPGAVAIASTVADVTMEALAQGGYTTLGLGILAARHPGNHLIIWMALGLAIGLTSLVAFGAMQRHGFGRAARLMAPIVTRCFRAAAVGRLAPVSEALRDIWTHGPALRMAGLLHFAAWIVSAVEAWMALHFMGIGLGLGAVIATESLIHAIRSVAFAVPNALGIQEGAYIRIGGTFGLPPDAALALSLLKRARDLSLGVPALLSWQIAESSRLLAGRPPVAAGWKAERPTRTE